MSAESEESTAIPAKVMRIAYLKAFPSPKIGLSGIVIGIIQMRAKITARQTMNLTLGKAMASAF